MNYNEKLYVFSNAGNSDPSSKYREKNQHPYITLDVHIFFLTLTLDVHI
jgi:hypothetical protein